MFQDLRFAFRVLTSKPLFTLAATVSLALGIGANSAIFGLIDALWLRPLAVPESSRIVRVFTTSHEDREGELSYPEFRDLRSQSSALKDVVAKGGRGALFDVNGTRRLVTLNLVSANFFTALGVQPALGTMFSEASRKGGAAPVVVIGNAAWHRYFGGDPTIVGKQIRILRVSDTTYTVAAVLPASFREIDAGDDRDFWFPEDCWQQLGRLDELEMRGNRWFHVIARVAPGASIESAQAELKSLGERMAAANAQTNKGRGFRVVSDRSYRLDQAGNSGLGMLAVVMLVVIISAVNVANLLLSRANVRGKEMAVRLALGANRGRLVRQLMVESLMLGAAGLGLGALLGWWLIAWIPSLMVTPPGFDGTADFQFNGRVLGFSLAVTLATTLIFGLVPALRFTRLDLVPVLKTGMLFGGRQGRWGWPLRNWLVVAEVAVAMTLLVCSGVLARSFSMTRTADLGFARRQTLLVWIEEGGVTPAHYRSIAARFASLPGVKEVALAVRAPLSLSSGLMFRRVTFPGRTEFAATPPFEIKYNSVSPEFLDVMGTPVERGRGFDQREESASSDSVLINEAMARRYFADVDPLGRSIEVSGKLKSIIGVVRNAPINAVGEMPEPYLYLPFWADFGGEVTFFIRTEGDAAALANPARLALKQIDARVTPLGITTMNDLIHYSAGRFQIAAELGGVLGILGLILTAVGLFGVVSYGISQRAVELGIRMALGAGPRETRLLVLREVAMLGAAGAAIGLPLASASTHLLASMLFGVGPWDVPAFLGSAVLLMAVLLVAGFIPARRATAVAPASVLRSA